MERCCATCKFWLEGTFKSHGYGWCQNAEVKADTVNGTAYEGGAGMETYAASICEKWVKEPPKSPPCKTT